MRKIVLTLFLVSFLAIPAIVTGAATIEVTPAPDIGLLPAIEIIINVLFMILATVAVIFVMLGAFALLTAQGDAEKISDGRQKILYSIIAVVVAIMARGAIIFIRGVFPGAS